jgi:hypothetical protein
MRRLIRAGLSVVVAASAAVVFGQAARPTGTPAPSAQIATPPAQARKRQEMVIPPGYQKVTAGDHTVLCEAGEVAWVRQAVADIKPTPKPNITPADVVKALPDKRAGLAKQVEADLALKDDRTLGEFLDGKLVPTLKKLQDFRPPVFYLVTTQPKLRDLTRTGWGEPRYHYNGVADAAAYDTNIAYTIMTPMDDVVLPAMYDEKMPTDARVKALTSFLQDHDARMANLAASQVNPVVFSLFVEYLRERHLDALKLRRDQQWLVMGLSNYLAVKYTNTVTGAPREEMLRQLATEPQDFPVGARAIDLTKPADESTLRPQLVPYYTQAMQRKALAVVAVWVEQAGEGAIPKTLTALRAKTPADAAGLVKAVQEASGVDVGRYLAPG